jgi:hypothetical protein
MDEVISSTRLIATGVKLRAGWILSLPIQILASAITWIRARRYDPEKVMCPACGFKGYTDKRTSTIKFTRDNGPRESSSSSLLSEVWM